ncbi:hypothetical protein K1T71_001952 [Dendrolimus kikuchii]|uniref:Uncharacterized protein n=1 Tax=Dendrolimus kikuchii TaxID=765133 RepID=A0ACC1DF54_9NEOP|nr:hypothetical protein K1T71_001952 [Dendrolimus kikuchii]
MSIIISSARTVSINHVYSLWPNGMLQIRRLRSPAAVSATICVQAQRSARLPVLPARLYSVLMPSRPLSEPVPAALSAPLELPKGKKPSDGGSGTAEGGAEKKNEKENPLRRIKSRELRGGIMYYSCHCIKRNGLQHDCRRTGCGGEPPCLVLPDPLCAPSQLARARGLADPAPLAAHMQSQSGGGAGGSSESGSGSGKKFIVCELKGITPEVSADKSGKCCCSAPGGGGASAGGGPVPGMPMLVMKLC